jgi:hypothetical protein
LSLRRHPVTLSLRRRNEQQNKKIVFFFTFQLFSEIRFRCLFVGSRRSFGRVTGYIIL